MCFSCYRQSLFIKGLSVRLAKYYHFVLNIEIDRVIGFLVLAKTQYDEEQYDTRPKMRVKAQSLI